MCLRFRIFWHKRIYRIKTKTNAAKQNRATMPIDQINESGSFSTLCMVSAMSEVAKPRRAKTPQEHILLHNNAIIAANKYTITVSLFP